MLKYWKIKKQNLSLASKKVIALFIIPSQISPIPHILRYLINIAIFAGCSDFMQSMNNINFVSNKIASNLKFQPSIDNIQKLIQNLDVKNEVKTRNQKAFSQMQNYNDRNQKKIKLYKENYNYLENFES